MNNGEAQAQRFMNTLPAINVLRNPTNESSNFMNRTKNFLKNKNVSENIKLRTMKTLLNPNFKLDERLHLPFPYEGIYYRFIGIVMDAKKNGWGKNIPRVINFITKTAKARLVNQGQPGYLGAAQYFRNRVLNSNLFTHNEIMKLIPGIRKTEFVPLPYQKPNRYYPDAKPGYYAVTHKFRNNIFRNEPKTPANVRILRSLEAARKKKSKELANKAAAMAPVFRKKRQNKLTASTLLAMKPQNLPKNIEREIIGRVHTNLQNESGR